MMPGEFPAPFGGFRTSWTCSSPEEFVAGVRRLSTCHQHNFAVDGIRAVIWGSEMEMECLREEMTQLRSHEDAYDRAESFFFDQLADWFTRHTQTRRRDMPANIATNLRRALQQQGLVLAERPDETEMARWEPDIIEKPVNYVR
jgi:hypothetical protein